MKSDQEIMQSIRAAIDDCTKGIDNAPSLQYQIARKVNGGEMMAKKISAAAILVIAIIIISMTAALAAALNGWGIINFAGNHVNAYVPPKYEESITKENEIIETESVRCTIQESYYDGQILRMTALIVPKTDVLLIGPGTSAEDPISELFWQRLNPEDEETEWESIGSYALREHGGHLAEVNLSVDMQWDDCASDFMRNEDGSYTFYLECQSTEEASEANMSITLYYLPMTISEEQLESGQVNIDLENKETASIHKTFRSVATKTFVCDTPLDFSSVGVRIQCVTLTVTPLEIRCALDYEITDLNLYKAQQDGLWFEFIDPNSEETESYAQRVSEGLTSGGSWGRLDGKHDLPDEVGTIYRQRDAIGLDALSDQYTIRAYNAWEKTRYEAVTFHVTEKN